MTTTTTKTTSLHLTGVNKLRLNHILLPWHAWVGNYLQGKAGLTRNAAKAYEYYQLAAKQGNADALFQVAQMLERGLGCMHDFQQAAQCYTRLIQDCACPESMFCLGNLYMMGDGVPMDTDRAFSLWEKAAKLGHEGAQSFVTSRDLAL
jgi:TPR repeat protein